MRRQLQPPPQGPAAGAMSERPGKPVGLIVASAAAGGVSAQSFLHTFTLASGAFNLQVATPGGKLIDFVDVNENNMRWIQDFRMKSYANPAKLESIDGARYHALLIPNCPGAMTDLANSGYLAKILQHFCSENKPICAVGHGVAALCCATNEDKSWLFHGYSLTGPSVYELIRQPDFGSLSIIMEDFVKDSGAIFSASKPDGVHVVLDRHLVTGQNENSTAVAVQNLILLCNSSSNMAEQQTDQDSPGPSREQPQGSQDPPWGSKRRAPSFSEAEIQALLDLWAKEESLQDPKTRRRNAEIYSRMASALAQQGHPPRSLEQVRSKVKELRQGYARARDAVGCSGAEPPSCPYYWELHRILGRGDTSPPCHSLDLGLKGPLVVKEEEEDQPPEGQPQEPESETSSLVTALDPGPGSQDTSCASSELGEGSSTGPALSEGRATPISPPGRARSRRSRWRLHADLMRDHNAALWAIRGTMERRLRADTQWRSQAWDQLMSRFEAVTSVWQDMLS
ncbi:glutamine amidotransferase-like class 1 domain-containing protein 1 isoform X1 [Carettochelys insculpta]|uniref:glutamine amidotransferase-like class 1 domain-containing protein 1 isoform X1 n=1 Tax=Carettochelys insculpta TaxID=44489 RepID=UPI003EBAC0A5